LLVKEEKMQAQLAQWTLPAVEKSNYDTHSRRDLLIQAKQIAQLYEQIPTTVSGSILAALVLAASLRANVPGAAVAGWLALIVAFQLWRVAEFIRYRRRKPSPAQLAAWGGEYAAGSFVSGLIWGSAGLVLGLDGSTSFQALVYLILFGMATASVSVISSYAPALFAFVIPTMLPAIVVTALRGGATDFVTAAVGLLFLLVTLRFGWLLNRRLVEAYRAGYENADLVQELSAQKRAADAARDEAERATQQKSALVEELTVQKSAAEDARAEAESAAQSRARFLAAASHDLRQPLHALGLLVGALSEKIRFPDVRRIVDNMENSVHALDELFNALLDISKLDAGVIQPRLANVPLQNILDRLKADFGPSAAEKELRFTVRACRHVAYSDAILLQRIVRNLVSNAVRHTERGGVVVGCRRRGNHIVIEVWDTGPGIPTQEQTRIFDEFYQLRNPERDRNKGLGLGLAIVRRLVDLLGYKLDVVSRVGRGSCFKIELPVGRSEAMLEDDPPVLPARAMPLAGARIFVIDDESAIRDSMELVLTQWGCEVTTAASAEEALERLDADARVDLIIADYRLRDNAVGTDAIDKLQAKLRREIPSILITGDTGPDRLREAQATGVRLLHKPVPPARLRAAIHATLKRT
jgi:two-component system, sensor histidine kinase